MLDSYLISVACICCKLRRVEINNIKYVVWVCIWWVHFKLWIWVEVAWYSNKYECVEISDIMSMVICHSSFWIFIADICCWPMQLRILGQQHIVSIQSIQLKGIYHRSICRRNRENNTTAVLQITLLAQRHITIS